MVLWGGPFRAAHVHIITGVIPSNFKYDNLFLSKLTSLHVVGGLYICTKFYQGMSLMSDHVVDFNHVKGWSFLRGLSRCYKPVLNHKKKRKSTTYKTLTVCLFLLWHELLLPYSCPILRSLGWLHSRLTFISWQVSCGNGYQSKLSSTHGVIELYIYTKFIMFRPPKAILWLITVMSWSWNSSYNRCHPLWFQIQ